MKGFEFARLPLTKRAHVFAYGSAGLAIFSRKGRGRVPRLSASLEAPSTPRVYLSPCGRGYAGPVSKANRWPKLVRGNTRGDTA